MWQKIDSAIRAIKYHTGIVLSKSDFRVLPKSSDYSYYDTETKLMHIIANQPMHIIYHEIGHYIFDKYKLGSTSQNNKLARKFRDRFGLAKDYAGKHATAVSDESTSPEEDFCWAIADILTGRSSAKKYNREARNKIRTAESIIRDIWKQNAHSCKY